MQEHQVDAIWKVLDRIAKAQWEIAAQVERQGGSIVEALEAIAAELEEQHPHRLRELEANAAVAMAAMREQLREGEAAVRRGNLQPQELPDAPGERE